MSLIGVGGGVRMRFEEVYVPLRIGRRPERHEMEAGKEREKWLVEAAGDLQVEEIFTAPHTTGYHALILGHPGSGKTTALLKLLHQCLQGPESLGLAPGTLPVFLRLRRLRPDDLEQDHPLAVLLARELAEVGAGALPPDLGERLWKNGRPLLLLDGLDEIAAEPLRARVCQTLDWELAGPARAVVSCRFAGYGNRVQLGERFLPLEVRPLDADQCRRLVDLWFREAPRALPDFPEAEARRAAERRRPTLTPCRLPARERRRYTGFMRALRVEVSDSEYEALQKVAEAQDRSVEQLLHKALLSVQQAGAKARKPLRELPLLPGHGPVGELPKRADLYEDMYSVEDSGSRS